MVEPWMLKVAFAFVVGGWSYWVNRSLRRLEDEIGLLTRNNHVARRKLALVERRLNEIGEDSFAVAREICAAVDELRTVLYAEVAATESKFDNDIHELWSKVEG